MEDIWSTLNCVPRNTFTKIPEIKSDKPASLKQIQQEEKQAKISEQRQNHYLSKINNETISHALVEERMSKCFEGILEPVLLKEILQAKNYDMKATVECITDMTNLDSKEYQQKLDRATIGLWGV